MDLSSQYLLANIPGYLKVTYYHHAQPVSGLEVLLVR